MERPSHRHQRHPVEATHWLALARSPAEIRPLADLLRSLQPLEERRHLGDRLLAHAQTNSDAVGEIEWEVSVDDTVVRAHHHAAGARRKPAKGEDAKGGS
jgi:hypothetical protein